MSGYDTFAGNVQASYDAALASHEATIHLGPSDAPAQPHGLRWKLCRWLIPGYARLDDEIGNTLDRVDEQADIIDRNDVEAQQRNDQLQSTVDLLGEETGQLLEDVPALQRQLNAERARVDALACLLAAVAGPIVGQLTEAFDGIDDADPALIRAGLLMARPDGRYQTTDVGQLVADTITNATTDAKPF